MKRIVKNPDVRKAEIILAAKKLFEKKGYSSTSVEAIIKEAGIAKGTFYYYFKAKQDILSALVEHIGLDLAAHFEDIAERANLNAVEKLRLMFTGPEKRSKTNTSVMKILHKPENRELQEQLNIQSVEMIAPLMAKVMEQGKREGVFHRMVSVESLQIILAGSLFVLDSGLFKWSPSKRAELIQSGQEILELITGAKQGALKFITELE